MPTGESGGPVRSLAAVHNGEAVEIRRVLFGALRALCMDLGVQEGDIVRCRAGTASHLLLLTTSGRTVPLDREWARFIQVATVPEYAAPQLRPETGAAAV